jgi:ribosomal protein S7
MNIPQAEADKRIVQGKGTLMDKLPYITSLVSSVIILIVIIYMVATGKKNKAKSIAKGAFGAMGELSKAMTK